MNNIKHNLCIGDSSDDGSVIILDQDRLCYKVKSVSNGAVGVRTISKALLCEWVSAYEQDPKQSAETVRGNLRGKSEIDRYEYGYAGTLAKMAKMVLGQLPIAHLSVEEGRRKEFYDWLISKKLTPDYADDLVNAYLVCLSDELKMPPVKTAWHGLREYLYGEKPGKSIFAVADSHELTLYYGEIDRLFAKEADPGALDVKRFNECRAWADSKDNNRAVRAAWGQYKEFMKWRDARQSTKELPKNVDRLSVALKSFAEKRTSSPSGSEKSYDEIYAETRAEAARIDGDYLVACNYDDFRKTLNDRQVANAYFSKHTDVEKKLLGDFIAAVRQDPKDISFYLTEANRPQVPGIGDTMLTAFLTRTRPDIFGFYTNQMFESVKFLGLTKDSKLPDLTPDSYNTYKGIQTAIRDRMREMGIKAENGNDADYLTVNEFTWFVSENKDLIKEQVMSKQMSNATPTKYDEGNRKTLSFTKGSKDDKLLLRLLSALRAKPFAILAGHSGTGKSRYVKKLAYMTCNMEELHETGKLPGNYLLLQVKPNWHDSTDLLGFRNAMDGNRYQKTALIEFLFKAYHFRETPFFLCLDEMNLAPVEQYFAEFLSAMESKEPVPLNDIKADEDNLIDLGCLWTDSRDYLSQNGFSIPDNLFVVGTVNMDETTNQFSRKVLDRAFTIEMTDVDFSNFGKVVEPSYADLIEEDKIQALLHGDKVVAALDPDDVKEDAPLVKIQKVLEPTAFAIAYRFANEYTLLKRAIELFDPTGEIGLDALDQAVLMKILPRIAGEKDYIFKVYGEKESEGLQSALSGKTDSLEKVKTIIKRANDMNAQYVMFWP